MKPSGTRVTTLSTAGETGDMRNVQKYRYGAALAITLMVFVMGVMFSNLVDQTRSSSLENDIQKDLTDLESNQLQLSYLRSGNVKSCGTLRVALTNIVRGYNQRLGSVQKYQKDSYFSSGDFKNLKRKYILSGIRYWTFAEEIRERCEYNQDTVLFFTTTLEKDDCPACEKTGNQLSLLKKKYGNDLLIFSIPTRMDDGMVEVLMNQYNVTDTPKIVINGNKTLEGYQTRQEIEKHLSGGS